MLRVFPKYLFTVDLFTQNPERVHRLACFFWLDVSPDCEQKPFLLFPFCHWLAEETRSVLDLSTCLLVVSLGHFLKKGATSGFIVSLGAPIDSHSVYWCSYFTLETCLDPVAKAIPWAQEIDPKSLICNPKSFENWKFLSWLIWQRTLPWLAWSYS